MKRLLSAALAGAAVATFSVVGFAAAAHAQEDEHGADHEELIHEAEEVAEENGATHADVECIPILIEGGTVEECQEAPNPLLPERNEIIWGAIGFTVVFLFLARFGYPAIKKAMNDRTERIRADLDAAETARTDALAVKADYEARVADANSRANQILDEARQQAEAMKADAQARLNEELAAARAQAQADIDAAKGQAMAELRGEVANIAIGAAETVVRANLDRNAQIQLIEDYINRVGSNGQG